MRQLRGSSKDPDWKVEGMLSILNHPLDDVRCRHACKGEHVASAYSLGDDKQAYLDGISAGALYPVHASKIVGSTKSTGI